MIFVIAFIYLIYQNGKLKDQVKAYKQCVGDYQDQEQKFKTAIVDANSYLEGGSSYNYRNAQDALNVDTTEVSCDIPQ